MNENRQAPTQEDIDTQLAALNDAYTRHQQAATKIELHTADTDFQRIWEWFMEHGIRLHQKTNTTEWIVEQRLTFYISTNTYTSLLDALKRHQVVLMERGECLKAIFPEGTRKMPQADLPGTFLLTLPDGWTVQELPLRQRHLAYTSILVPSKEEEPLPHGTGVLWMFGTPEGAFKPNTQQ